jgi:hypothetical protein
MHTTTGAVMFECHDTNIWHPGAGVVSPCSTPYHKAHHIGTKVVQMKAAVSPFALKSPPRQSTDPSVATHPPARH